MMSKQEEAAPPAPDVLRLVRKTALLNVGIVLSGLATSACLGGPATLPAVAVLLTVVSIATWAITFTFISSSLLLRILLSQGRRTPPRSLANRRWGRSVVGDDWMDGPF